MNILEHSYPLLFSVLHILSHATEAENFNCDHRFCSTVIFVQ